MMECRIMISDTDQAGRFADAFALDWHKNGKDPDEWSSSDEDI